MVYIVKENHHCALSMQILLLSTHNPTWIHKTVMENCVPRSKHKREQ